MKVCRSPSSLTPSTNQQLAAIPSIARQYFPSKKTEVLYRADHGRGEDLGLLARDGASEDVSRCQSPSGR